MLNDEEVKEILAEGGERVFDNPFMDVHSEVLQRVSVSVSPRIEEIKILSPEKVSIHEKFYKKQGWDWEHSGLNPKNHPVQ